MTAPELTSELTSAHPGALETLRRRPVILAGAGLVFFLALALASAQFVWQVATLELADAKNCLVRFKSNRVIGWLLFLGLAGDMALGTLAAAFS